MNAGQIANSSRSVPGAGSRRCPKAKTPFPKRPTREPAESPFGENATGGAHHHDAPASCPWARLTSDPCRARQSAKPVGTCVCVCVNRQEQVGCLSLKASKPFPSRRPPATRVFPSSDSIWTCIQQGHALATGTDSRYAAKTKPESARAPRRISPTFCQSPVWSSEVYRTAVRSRDGLSDDSSIRTRRPLSEASPARAACGSKKMARPERGASFPFSFPR